MHDSLGSALVLLDATDAHLYIAITAFPAGIAVLFTPLMNQNVPQVVTVGRPVFASTKSAVACAMLTAQMVNFAIWCKKDMFSAVPAMLAAVISLITPFIIAIFIHSPTQYAFPSATFHNAFLATTVFYDLAMAQPSTKGSGSFRAFQFVAIVLKLLYVLLNVSYGHSVVVLETEIPEEKDYDASSPTSVWACASWPGLISIPDLQQNFGVDQLPEPEWQPCSEKLLRKFKLHWDRIDKNSSQALITAITSTLGGTLLSIIPLRFLHALCTLAQPLFLWHILTTVFRGDISRGTVVTNLTVAAIIWVGLPVLRLAFAKQSDRFIVSTRAILLAALHDKMMTVSARHIRNSSSFLELTQGMKSIELLIESTQDFVSAVIQMWLGMCCLWPFISSASLLVFAPTTLVAVATFLNGKQELRRRSLVKERRDSRVALTSSILKQLRSIKMTGLGAALAVHLRKQKKAENDALLLECRYRLREFSLLAFNHSMTPVLVIAGYMYWVKPSKYFGAAEIFTCFVLIRIISKAFNVAVDRLSQGQEGSEILARIQKFLLLEDVTDKRMLVAPAEDNETAATPTVHVVRATVMSDAGDVILLEATLRAFRYSVTIVFEPVASGKSTLMRLILGEVAPTAGRIAITSALMTFCDEEAWLPGGSIQQIIVGSAIFVEEWYIVIIDAFLLKDDFSLLPQGDMTVVGGSDCQLSLGLKQRISLARAFYERPTTVVLDEPLSAVKVSTALKIFGNLFNPQGVVFNLDCTVIMATNAFPFLKFADAIFTVDYDGRVMSQDVTSYTSRANTIEVLQNSNGLYEGTLADDDEACEPGSWSRPEQSEKEEKAEAEVEAACRRIRDYSLYSYFQQPAGKFLTRIWPFVVAIAAMVEKMPEIFWALSLPDDILRPAHVASFAAFGIANIICNRVAAHVYLNHISTTCSEALHWRLIKTVMTATPGFASNANPQSVLKLFDVDLETISRRLPTAFMQSSFTLVSITLDTIIISFCAKYTTAFVIALSFLLFRIYTTYLPFSKRLRILEASTLEGVLISCLEAAAGVEYIRAFEQQRLFTRDFHQALTRSQKPHYCAFKARRQLEYTIALFAAAVGLVVLGLAHANPQSSSPVKLGLALVSIVELKDTLNLTATIWAQLDEYIGAVFRVRRFCDETPAEVDDQEESLPAKWPIARSFELFSFVPENDTAGASWDNPSAVDAYLEGSQKIVVPTRTGSWLRFSGHSLLILAMLRMINYSGAVRLDDVNIKNVPPEILRSRITTITRESIELEGTLRLNLDPLSVIGPFFRDAELISMLHRVKLWDTVQRQGGLDASMKHMRFSKAQKELLNLARGALHRRREDTKLVLIEDAVTRLDSKTNARMQDFINGEFATCTILMVTRDLEAVRTADTVITVEHGAITNVLER